MHRRRYRGGRTTFICITALSVALVLTGALCVFAALPAGAAETAQGVGATAAPLDGLGYGLGFLGMALSTGLACVGAGVALGSVGSAALGLLGEQPEAIGKTLIYVGLAESVAIYGIVISIMIFTKLA